MTVPVRAYDYRYYPTNPRAGYASHSVSRPADPLDAMRHEGSTTVRESQPALLTAVWNAQDEPGVSEATIGAAVELICAIPEGLPAPEISPEHTGEIAFEWYKDSSHVAVLTVQDGIIRWSALMGAGAPVYGREFFTGTVPGVAMLAIQSVIE